MKAKIFVLCFTMIVMCDNFDLLAIIVTIFRGYSGCTLLNNLLILSYVRVSNSNEMILSRILPKSSVVSLLLWVDILRKQLYERN